MIPFTQADAQQRADEIRVFKQELERLEQNGVLTLSEQQRYSVSTHHRDLLDNYTRTFDIDRTVTSRQLSIGMRVASFLGALALAASIFFLFYKFWGMLSTPVQVTTLLLASLGTFLGTMWVQSNDATGYFTKLAAMVTFACLVLDITMLGQIFNITPSENALIVWAAFALLLAYTCKLRLLLAAGILCFVGFIAARTGTWGGLYWLDFGERPENFFPAAIVLFLTALFVPHRNFAGFAVIYRVFSLLTLFLPVLVLANWGDGSYFEIDPVLIKHSYQVAGFLLSIGAIWLGIRNYWSEVVNTGVVFFVIFLYTKFYDWWWESIPKYLFFFVLSLTALLLLVVLKRLRAMQSEEAK
ncbi:DUF2157 domain-containing protein [Pseudomonas sp. GM48]|uniref:DUF2157 domain-containing protein n=1 Tax=Pseudomonas sp. GM48 TaxID=1144330 RepID=UPI00026FD579|nr:DUF2157 domain-containing protein [Pseudomonas sp. GM48]EJM53221.1 putative membrane protein (DUF2157) [Pseudomonas sp. GM48]